MLQKVQPRATSRYNAPAQLLHWLTALVIFTTIPLGWIIAHMGRETPNHYMFIFFHKSFGMLALMLIIARLVWRSLRKPPPLPDWTAKWEIGLAHATHAFLYLIFIVMPVTGYISSAAGGHGVSFFGLPLPVLPEDKDLAKKAIEIHLAVQYLVYFFFNRASGRRYLACRFPQGWLSRADAARPGQRSIEQAFAPLHQSWRR